MEKLCKWSEVGESPSSWWSRRAEPLSRGFKEGKAVRLSGEGEHSKGRGRGEVRDKFSHKMRRRSLEVPVSSTVVCRRTES